MTTTKERNYLFDNLKGWLLILVVFAHAIEYANYRCTGVMKYLYTAIYLFHMPVFIFISGYFSKKKNYKKLISFSITYLIWQMLIFPISLSILTKTPYLKNYRAFYFPQVSYWYLMALIIWRFITPFVSKFKYSFIVSLIPSVLFGFLNLNINLQHFTIGRLIVFYPFFLSGYLSNGQTIEKFKKINKKLSLPLFLSILSIGTFIIHYLAKYGVNPERMNRILMPHYWYSECYNNIWLSLVVKLTIMAIGFVSIPLCFNITRKAKTWLSDIGQNSLYIYLIHMIFVESIRINYLKTLSFSTGNRFLIAVAFASIIYCILLSKAIYGYNILKNKYISKNRL